MKILPIIVLVAIAATVAGYLAWQASVTNDPLPAAGAVSVHNAVPPVENGTIAETTAAAVTANEPTDSDCTIVSRYLPKEDGTVIEVVSCERDVARETHPYESYANAALESLAYSDAKAAEILGMRLIESDEAESLSLIVRAAALSGGNTAPILAYSNAWPHPVRINGVLQPKTVRVKYVLYAVADLLQDDRLAPNQWESVIRDHSADPDRELAMLQARARAIVDEMRRIQLDVVGNSTIGGPGDA